MRYLSDEWIEAARRALENRTDVPAGTLVIDQHVADALSYRVTINDGRASVAVIDDGPDASADATFRQSLATATAVANGDTDAHQAFLLGKIRFDGDINTLIEHQDTFAWLEGALAPVQAETTFD